MIDRKYIGHALPTVTWEAEKGRLRFFAKAIGEADPIYLDEAAAKAAGYRSLLAPPTFGFAAELDTGVVEGCLDLLGIPIARILHGEQRYTYHAPICAGDTLRVESRISDIYDKKGGALEFIVKDSRVINQEHQLVAEARSVIVVRNA